MDKTGRGQSLRCLLCAVDIQEPCKEYDNQDMRNLESNDPLLEVRASLQPIRKGV